MIYNRLSALPMVLFAEISEFGDTSLLDTDGQPQPEIWDKLKSEYDQKYNKSESKKHFSLIKEIYFLENKYTVIKLAVEALKFDANNDVIEILANYGYRIKIETYHNDLESISKQSESILLKVMELRNKLPKQEESVKESARDGILKALSSYSAILGFDLDYYTVSVEKFFLLGENVTKKIKALENK